MSDFRTLIDTMHKEERLFAVLVIKVFFKETPGAGSVACTYQISRLDAVISHIAGIVKVDQCVWLQWLKERAKYRVKWIGEPGTPRANQVGLELLDTEEFIWGDSLSNKLI